jgi:hypothetical protein
MTQLPKAEVLRVLRMVGMAHTAQEIGPQLPDPVDLEREAGLFAGLGINQEVLVDRMGGSP